MNNIVKNALKRRHRLTIALIFLICLAVLSTIYTIKSFADNVDLNIAQTVDEASPLTGQPFTFTIKYANPSTTADVYNATITDVLPSNLEYVSSDTSGDIAKVEVTPKDGPGGHDVVTFVFNSELDAGKTGIIKLTAKFPEGVTPATVDGVPNTATNQPSITADNSAPTESNPVTVTPVLNAQQSWSVSKTLSVPLNGRPALDNPVTYAIVVKGTAVQGGLNLKDVTVTDLLPANTVYMSSTYGGTYEDGSVEWYMPSLAVGATKTVYVTVEYPSAATDPVNYFTEDESVTNNVMAAANLYDGTPAPTVTGSCTHHFYDPVVGVSQLSKTTRQPDERYAQGQTANYYIGNIHNTGNVPLDRIDITDNIPDEIDLTKITTGSFSSDCSVEVMYQVNHVDSWMDFTGQPFGSADDATLNVSSLGLSAGDKVTAVMWRVTNGSDGLPAGFANDSQLVVTGGVNAAAPDSFTNTAMMTGYSGAKTPATSSASKQITVIDQMGWLNPALSVQGGQVSFNYGDTVTFNLQIANHGYATGSLTDPVAVDVLPDQFEDLQVVGWDSGNSSITAAPGVTTFTTTGGQSAARWNFTGSLDPGQYVDVQIKAKIKDQTPVGYLTDTMYMTTADSGDTYENESSLTPDTNALIDESETHELATSTSSVFVKFKGGLSSNCLVQGQLDTVYKGSQYPATSVTYSGGVANYELQIANSGSNGPVSNVVVIDKLPGVGDTGVLDRTGRDSQWTPYLVNQMTATITDKNGDTLSTPFEIYYSTNSDPSCTELSDPVGNTGSGSDGWSTALPADITTVRSLKFVLGPDVQLNAGDTITLEWPMRAPADAPTDKVAWNSFGYVATYQDASTDGLSTVQQPFLPSEPLKAGFSIASPVPANLGNFVFDDKNKDGIQGQDEPGINGVLVNLYKETDPGVFNDLAGYTRTGDNAEGKPGYYLFPDLSPGVYKVEFVYPQAYTDPSDPGYQTPYYVSPEGKGGDITLDSDADPGTLKTYDDNGVTKNSVTTGEITINAVDNYNIDAGIYELGSLSGTAWYDRNADGAWGADETRTLPGATVRLLNSDGTRAKQHDGVTDIPDQLTDQNGDYTFLNLEPGSYKVEFTAPGDYALSQQGQDSDADPSTGITGALTVNGGDRITGVDEGMHLGSIGDTVFNDQNANGYQDAGDAGIPGVTVRLLNTDGSGASDEFGNPVPDTVTDSSGLYSFDDLAPGSYIVQVGKPSGYGSFSPEPGGGTTQTVDGDNDFGPNGETGTVTLAAGDRITTIDAGIYKFCSIGDFVWNDLNANGIQDSGETGLAGVTVSLSNAADGSQVTDGKGQTVQPVITGTSGAYSFGNLNLGNYIVTFSNPSQNYLFSQPSQGSDRGKDSDGVYTTQNDPAAKTAAIALTVTGTGKTDVDQGMFGAQIGNLVFNDKNADGYNSGDAGISGVTVNLLKASDLSLVATTSTNGSGSYLFNTVAPGDYIVQFALPSGYNKFSVEPHGGTTIDNTTDSDVGQDGKTATIHITAGERDTASSIDAGAYKFGSIGDFVWNDYNGNGVQDSGEPGLKGVTVKLLSGGSQATDGNGQPVQPVTTGPTGAYSFGSLNPGIYEVEFDRPSGSSLFSQPLQGGNTAKDSNGTYTLNTDAAAYANNVTLISGTNDSSIDQGMYFARLGDRVWEDQNANGIQDSGEPGIAGVTVQLMNDDGSPAHDIYNNVESTTTDSNGNYYFNNLASGNYYVQFTMPSGFDKATAQYAGGDTGKDSNIPLSGTGGVYKTETFSLPVGSINLTEDAGFYKTATIGNFAWHDVNGNGIQDNGEPGIPGATVRLLNSDGSDRAKDADGAYIPDTTTASDGSYSFTNIKPGTYIASFDLPTGYNRVALKGKGTAATGSKINSNGKTDAFTVISKQVDNDIDAGYYNTTAINGKAWEDADADGVQDDAAVISGATVTLLDSSGNPAYNADGALVAPATTAGDGSYAFTGLRPDSYIVKFSMPSGYTTATAKYATADITKDSDLNPSTLKTDAKTLLSGTPVYNVDAGFYHTVSIGDLVWNDLNADGVQNGGESGISGAQVTLENPDGSPATYPNSTTQVPAATTNSGGAYGFSGLRPGAYKLAFALPSGYAAVSPQAAAGDPTKDSDIDVVTRTTGTITLASGQSTLDADAGFYKAASIGNFVWNDLNGNGIQDDGGSSGIQGASVTLQKADGSAAYHIDGSAVAPTVSGSGGAYSFNSLAPGVYLVLFSTPAGYTGATVEGAGGDAAKDSDMDQTSLMSDGVTLVSGQADNDVDAGFYKAASITDRVWNDTNADGIRQGGEPGIQGITVTLLDNGGRSVASEQTGPDGTCTFGGLVPGTYYAEITKPSSFRVSPQYAGSDTGADSDIFAATCETGAISLHSGDNLSGYDAGLFGSTSITGRAWQDLNADGLRNDGEPVIAGDKVSLTDASGNPVNDADGDRVAPVNTGAGGAYIFSNLVPGSYRVAFELPDGMTSVSPESQGTDETIDSDIAASGLKTAALTLGSGETRQNIDAGFYATASIGDYVFEDVNGDGVQGPEDRLIAGAGVTLLDGAGESVATTTTDTNGKYSFDGLIPGTYSLRFDLPAGMTDATLQNRGGDDAKDSDISPAMQTGGYTLTSGEVLTTADAGFYKAVQLGGTVWHDANGDGIQNDAGVIAGAKVSLLDTNGNAAVHADGSPVSDVTTGDDGSYLFTGLAPGSYSVKVVPPALYTLSPESAGTDRARDSDVDPAGGASAKVTLGSGETAVLDAGAYMPSGISGTVWNDQNKNGDIDDGEAGMQGIELDLYLDGTQISTSYADVNGDYAFNGLLPGSYSVKIKLPQGRVETYEPDGTLDGNIDAVLAEGQMIGDRDFGVYKLAPATIGNTVWNDANDNGIQDASEKGIAGITLALFDAENIFVKTTTTDSNGSYLFDGLDPGTYHIKITGMAGYDAVSPQDTTPDTDGNCDFDKTGVSYPVTVVYEQDQLTIDAGLYKYASLSNKVWLDTNKDGRIDNGEKGIPGVTVTIIDPNGVPLASTVTDANGNYRFDNLAPGKYHVKVTSPGNLNFEDNKDMIGGQSGAISLQSGQAASNVDTGLIRLGNPQTGDSSRDVSWLLVLISAAVGLLAGRIRLMGRRIRRSLKGN